MANKRQILYVVYGAFAFVALIATWGNNIAYVVDGNNPLNFFFDGYANYASSSLTNDILLVFGSAALFMLIEARRLGIRFVWLYIVGGAGIAISVTLPLFLIAREKRMAELEGASATGVIPTSIAAQS